MRVIELLRVEPHALLELLRLTDIEARHRSVISHDPCENHTLVALVGVLLQNFLVVLLCHIPLDQKGKKSHPRTSSHVNECALVLPLDVRDLVAV